MHTSGVCPFHLALTMQCSHCHRWIDVPSAEIMRLHEWACKDELQGLVMDSDSEERENDDEKRERTGETNLYI